MPFEKVIVEGGKKGDFYLAMYRALLASMKDTDRFRFLSYQIAMTIIDRYPPGELLDTAMDGDDQLAVKLPADVVKIIREAFEFTLPKKMRGHVTNVFLTNVFIRGISSLGADIGPDGDRRQWMVDITSRLGEMFGGE